jgi:phosphatidylglycerophosphatase A
MSEQTEAKPTKKPRVALWIATGFGLGYLPVAPGTWGSLGGIALIWGICQTIHPAIYFHSPTVTAEIFRFRLFLAAVIVAGLGVWAARRVAAYLGKSDPGQIVVDEISGQMLTFILAAPTSASLYLGIDSSAPGFFIWPVPVSWKLLVLGFILFRIFDIVKPPPARQAEKWPHGWGIMADDWFAGIYAAVVLWIVRTMGWLG